MSTTQTKAEPTMRAWECRSNGLPLALIRAYGQLQAKSEYRNRYQLHESRDVEVKEIK